MAVDMGGLWAGHRRPPQTSRQVAVSVLHLSASVSCIRSSLFELAGADASSVWEARKDL